MVGIAGWIDFSRPLGAPEEIARSMAAGLGNGLGGDTVLRATPHAGLALCAHPKMASSYFGEELWAVIHGYPRWHDRVWPRPHAPWAMRARLPTAMPDSAVTS